MEYVFNPFTGTLDLINDNYKGALSSAPSNPQSGWIYLNTTDHTLYIYYYAQWQVLHVLSAVSPEIQSGNPIGLLLGLTYTV